MTCGGPSHSSSLPGVRRRICRHVRSLNHYGGARGRAFVGISDDEALFGGARGVQAYRFGKYWISLRSSGGSLGPSPECEAGSCWLHHGDLLVMDGRCQDEYLHCTVPRLDGERVNITYRWLKNHLPRCPVGTGVMCCLPTCVRGSSCLGVRGNSKLGVGIWKFPCGSCLG